MVGIHCRKLRFAYFIASGSGFGKAKSKRIHTDSDPGLKHCFFSFVIFTYPN
jgi:hypothetical protein